MGMAADNLECYENLANAIILQAVKDYKTVLFRLEDIRTTGMRSLRKRGWKVSFTPTGTTR